MSTLERRLDRLEQGRGFACELWCCATEADAKALITRLKSEGLSPWFVFIAGQSNRDGAPCWHIKGRTVADLWRAIDGISPGLQLQEVELTSHNPRLEAVTD